MKRFSDRYLLLLRAKCARYDVHEGRGFYCRVETDGKKSFYYIYRSSGTLKPFKIGDYPAITLSDARKRHEELMAMREGGLDPAVALAVEVKDTFGELTKEYLKRQVAPSEEDHRAENKRILDIDVLPHWRDRPANQIGRSDVVTLLNRLVERGEHRQANKTLACIGEVFDFALSQGWPGLEHNPCAAISTFKGVDRSNADMKNDSSL